LVGKATCRLAVYMTAPGLGQAQRVWTQVPCAASGLMYTTESFAAHGRVFSTGASAEPGHVWTTVACAAL
jgi:hypothetical protein